MIDRDLLTSILPKEGLMGAFPAQPMLDEMPLIDLLGNVTDDYYTSRATLALPYREVKAQMDVDPTFLDHEQLQLKTYEVTKLMGSRLRRDLSQMLWEDVNWITSPDLVDAQTGVPIPRMASVNLSLDGALSTTQEALIALTRNLRLRASQSALSPCEWLIITHPAVWYPLAQDWHHPFQRWEKRKDWDCAYCGSNHPTSMWMCAPGCGSSRGEYVCLYCGRSYPDHRRICWDTEYGVGCGAIESMIRIADVDGLKKVLEDRVDFKDWVTETNKLPIDGFLYDVVVDGTAPSTSLYVLPKTVLGIPAMTRQFYPAQESIKQMEQFGLPYGNLMWSDDGEYMWITEQVKWSMTVFARTKQRIILRAPQLAGKLTDIPLVDPFTLLEVQ